ncbi:MAG: hypothetical protein NUW37_19255 [Planctomycetes bacterium]|nr:hypothetical protein [Planctomycetota bacterium]
MLELPKTIFSNPTSQDVIADMLEQLQNIIDDGLMTGFETDDDHVLASIALFYNICSMTGTAIPVEGEEILTWRKTYIELWEDCISEEEATPEEAHEAIEKADAIFKEMLSDVKEETGEEYDLEDLDDDDFDLTAEKPVRKFREKARDEYEADGTTKKKQKRKKAAAKKDDDGDDDDEEEEYYDDFDDDE